MKAIELRLIDFFTDMMELTGSDKPILEIKLDSKVYDQLVIGLIKKSHGLQNGPVEKFGKGHLTFCDVKIVQ